MARDISADRQRLQCNVPQVDDIFADCLSDASAVLSPAGIAAYLDGASVLCNLGRGQELVLIFLEEIPAVAKIAGEAIIPDIVETAQLLSRAGAAKGIAPFLSLLPACTRRLESALLLREYFRLIETMAREALGGVVPLLERGDVLLGQLTVGGLKQWVEYGLRSYRHQPHRHGDYFSLQAADSRAALQRERHGTLFVDHERRLTLYLQAFWQQDLNFHPYSLAFDTLRKPLPFLDRQGIHLPDVYDALNGIQGIDRYRALISHVAAHHAFTTPIIADNFSPFQQLTIETIEDARVEQLAIRRFPGLRRLWLALHPLPREGDCPPDRSSFRHRLAMLSRALLDPAHPYTDTVLQEYVERFHQRMAADPHHSTLSIDLGVAYFNAIQRPDFHLPTIYLKDTEVSYRDDNRYLWHFLEDTDDDEDFHSDHGAANPQETEPQDGALFSRHHPEWDYQAQHYRPDWTTVHEALQPAASPAVIDRLLVKHRSLAKKLKRIVDLLKPQQHVRIRYQEDGDALDLDIAIRAMVDYKTGTTPDPRVHFSHRHDGRDIAVTLLLDLSQSVNDTPAGLDDSVLQLSQEAVTLLAWAVDALGDPFSIAGFASNTRFDVRYFHFKGFDEPWGDTVKSRLAGMQGGLSTRMGAALRHAGHYLSKRRNSKKLLLLLTDGEPHDIDAEDPHYLKEDARKAVAELATAGVATYCITLDAQADTYVADIFGPRGYTVIDHIDKLPERLPQFFMSLTK